MQPSSTPGLDYVSPLPPVRSGIADYSIDLLPHLEPLCDLRVVRLPDQPVSPAVEERWHPASSTELGAEGRMPLFHMGNNRYHADVQALAMRTPGVMVLHDFVLHHFLIGETVGRGDLDTYRRRLRDDHGWQGESVGAVIRWGAFSDSLQFGLPAHRRLVRRQRGIVVHSEWAREMLLEENPDLQVRMVPMAVPLPHRVDPALGLDFRRRRGIPPQAPVLGTFGFQTPMKRPEVAVRALASSELAHAHLVIAGELAEGLELEKQIAAAGLSHRVHVTGFLSYDEFEAAISACDLALNLRYPSAGETSAALLRVLALGRPTLVSEYAQFAELPAAVAVKVPVGEGEVAAIARRSSELLGDPERLRAMGEAARQFVRRHHDPPASARAMAEAFFELSNASLPAATEPRVPAPTSLTWSTLEGDLEVRGHEAPWPEGERRRIELRLTNRGAARWLAAGEGPGGMAVRLTVSGPGGRVLEEIAPIPLPRDVDAGDSVNLEVALRRPIGSVVLRVEPDVAGYRRARRLGGLTWQSEI